MANELITGDGSPGDAVRTLPQINFEIRSVKLFAYELNLQTSLEVSAPENAAIEYKIGAEVTDIDTNDSYCLFFANYTVSKNINSEQSSAIGGRYIIVLDGNLSRDEWLPYVHLLASTTVWSRFADLCSLTMAQANLKWPSLPMHPPGVEWGDDTLVEEAA